MLRFGNKGARRSRDLPFTEQEMMTAADVRLRSGRAADPPVRPFTGGMTRKSIRI